MASHCCGSSPHPSARIQGSPLPGPVDVSSAWLTTSPALALKLPWGLRCLHLSCSHHPLLVCLPVYTLIFQTWFKSHLLCKAFPGFFFQSPSKMRHFHFLGLYGRKVSSKGFGGRKSPSTLWCHCLFSVWPRAGYGTSRGPSFSLLKMWRLKCPAPFWIKWNNPWKVPGTWEALSICSPWVKPLI